MRTPQRGRAKGGLATLSLLAVIAVCLSGCASGSGGFGTCRAPVGDLSLTPSRAVTDERVIGQWVTWGGVLLATRNRAETTELELLAYPLTECGRPLPDRPSRGRFILVYPGYLETADLRPGRLLTATGELVGLRDGSVGEAPVRFPLLEDPAPRLWPEGQAGYLAPRPVFSIGVGSGWRAGGVGLYW